MEILFVFITPGVYSQIHLDFVGCSQIELKDVPSSQEEQEVWLEVKSEVAVEEEERVEVEGVEKEAAIKTPKQKNMNLVRLKYTLN